MHEVPGMISGVPLLAPPKASTPVVSPQYAESSWLRMRAERDLLRLNAGPDSFSVSPEVPAIDAPVFTIIPSLLPDISLTVVGAKPLWRKPVFMISVILAVLAIVAMTVFMIRGEDEAPVAPLHELTMTKHSQAEVWIVGWQGSREARYEVWWMSPGDSPREFTTSLVVSDDVFSAYIPSAEVSEVGCVLVRGMSEGQKAAGHLPESEEGLKSDNALVKCTAGLSYSGVRAS